jgi:hypothetical protein
VVREPKRNAATIGTEDRLARADPGEQVPKRKIEVRCERFS